MTVHQQRGRYLDELEIGDIWQHRPGRTVTEADNLLFSALTMNRHSLHFDAEYAAATPFGERLVNSIFTLGVIVGLAVAELSRQKERLAIYATQARFAVAQLYDRATAARKDDRAPAQ